MDKEKQILDEEKQKLETECLKCFSNFQEANKGFITFNYILCKRCDVGRRLHEMDSPGWVADYVKSD